MNIVILIFINYLYCKKIIMSYNINTILFFWLRTKQLERQRYVSRKWSKQHNNIKKKINCLIHILLYLGTKNIIIRIIIY